MKGCQQLRLIQGMRPFLDVEVVPVETVREADGLAMSSRNLNPTQKRGLSTTNAVIRSELNDRDAALSLEKRGLM